MAEASNIGANFSSYSGDPNLGGGSLGFFKLDTKPLEDFARYTMLYNREEQIQRQKEAEKAAEELSKIADYDLTSSIQKDAKVLQDKYDKIISYVKENPGSLQFKNRDQWIKYQQLKNDLANDIKGAKTRSVLNLAREQEIANETDETLKNFLRGRLDADIDATDIRTPLKYTQQYDMTIPEFGKNAGQSLVVNRRLPNEIFQDEVDIFDAGESRRRGAAFALGVDFDENTTTGKLKQHKYENNFFVKGAEVLNQAIQSAVATIDPSLSAADQEADLKAKLSSVGIMKNIDAVNKYLEERQKEIKAGYYTDASGKQLIPEDYAPINWKDGVSPEELNVIAEFSTWGGGKQGTKIVQTNEAIEKSRLAAEWARIGISKEQLNKGKTQDFISATAVLREAADVIGGGQDYVKTVKGVETPLKRIAEPSLLKEFGTIDKDGNVTNVPDDVFFDPATNSLTLMYYKRDPNDNTTILRTTTGKNPGPIPDREVPLTGTQWLGQIVKRKNPNADIGGVNALVETFFNSKGVGRKLDNLKLIYGTDVNGAGGTNEDAKLNDAQYYEKYKKFRTKQ